MNYGTLQFAKMTRFLEPGSATRTDRHNRRIFRFEDLP